MVQYRTTVLAVRPSEIQPGDIVIGSAPSDVNFVHLPVPRERELILSRQSRPGVLRRASSLDRDERPDWYGDRSSIRRPRRPRREDRSDSEGGYGSEDLIARRRRGRPNRPYQQYPYDSEGNVARRRTGRRDRFSRQDSYNSDDVMTKRRDGRRDRSTRQDPYDSEGSIPPRSRRSKPSQKRGNSNSSSNSSDSSDLGHTTDDEKAKKKANWKKWGAIGLAGVATIHAVHGAHETVQKTRKRHQELAEGTITEGQAQKVKRRAHLRTVADVGIAAVWIKSAYDEMREYKEVRHEYKEACEKGEERHRKRLDRAKAIKNGEYHGHHTLDNIERYLSDEDGHGRK